MSEDVATFGPKDPSSRELFYIDFAKLLASDETIVSADSSIAIVGSGKDSNITSMLVGAPGFAGTRCYQMVQGGIAGLTYRLRMSITTSKDQVIPEAGDIPVRYKNEHC